MFYTKELLFSEFKDAEKKDQSSKEESYTNRIQCLKDIKDLLVKSPKYFSQMSITEQQLQNLIDDWSSPNPRDATYMRIFGMTYDQKKKQEELEFDPWESETEPKEKKVTDVLN